MKSDIMMIVEHCKYKGVMDEKNRIMSNSDCFVISI